MGGVSGVWTSGIVYYANTHYKHEYSVIHSIWPKSELSEFQKNPQLIMQNFQMISINQNFLNFNFTGH